MHHSYPRDAPLPHRFGRSGFSRLHLAAAFKHKTVVFFFCTLHSYMVLRHSFMYTGRFLGTCYNTRYATPAPEVRHFRPDLEDLDLYGSLLLLLNTSYFFFFFFFLYFTIVPGPKTLLHVHLQGCTWYNGRATAKLTKMHRFHPARRYIRSLKIEMKKKKMGQYHTIW